MILFGIAAAIGVGAYVQAALCRSGFLWGLYTACAYLLVWTVLSIASLGDVTNAEQGTATLVDVAAALIATFFVSGMARKLSR